MENICHAIHGLSAYAKADSAKDLIQRARWIKESCYEQEICVADQLIGPIGLVLAGPLSAVWDQDCWSRVDPETGLRCVSDESVQPDMENPTDTQWRQRVADVRWTDEQFSGSSRYLEAWMHHPAPLRVIYASEKWADKARSVARALGVPCEQVERHYRLSTPEPTGAIIDEMIAELMDRIRKTHEDRRAIMESMVNRRDKSRYCLRRRMDRWEAEDLMICATRERDLYSRIRNLREISSKLNAAEAA